MNGNGKNPAKVRAGQLAAQLRKQMHHTCLWCKEPFVGLKQAKFCSHSCRQMHWYREKQSRKGEEVYETLL